MQSVEKFRALQIPIAGNIAEFMVWKNMIFFESIVWSLEHEK